MILKKGDCEGSCGCKGVYIVNRKHMLCNRCNYLRLNGSDALEKKQNKITQSLKRVKNIKKISLKSPKQKSIDEEYKRVCLELIEDARVQDTYYCSGCGNPNNLSSSHIVRRSWDSKYTAVKENITFHCLVRADGTEGCHNRWETASKMTELLDFDKNMTFIRKVDPVIYWQLIGRIRETGLEIDTNSHKEI